MVQRIERYVQRIETEGVQPTVHALANFEVALECLDRSDYPGGEDAILWGEYGFAPRFPRARDPAPVQELIARFKELREGTNLAAKEQKPRQRRWTSRLRLPARLSFAFTIVLGKRRPELTSCVAEPYLRRA